MLYVKKKADTSSDQGSKDSGVFGRNEPLLEAEEGVLEVLDASDFNASSTSVESGSAAAVAGNKGVEPSLGLKARFKRSTPTASEPQGQVTSTNTGPQELSLGVLASLSARMKSKWAAAKVREIGSGAKKDPSRSWSSAKKVERASQSPADTFGPSIADIVVGSAPLDTSPPLKGAKKVASKDVLKAKKASKARKEGIASESATLLVELDNGRQLYWQLHRTKFTQQTEQPKEQVFSLSKEDFRFMAEGALTYKQASDHALREIGEDVQVINATKELKALYATRQERATGAAYRMVPGPQVLDKLLVASGKAKQPLITGFLFKDVETDASLAVLFYVGSDGEMSKPQISVNPDSMEFVVTQFSAIRKLNKSTTEVLLFGNEDFLRVAGACVPYANEAVWRGVPVRNVYWTTAAVFLAAATGSLGWAGTQYLALDTALQKNQRLVQESSKSKALVAALLKGSIPQFSEAMSLDVPALAKRGQILWLPGSRISLTADLTSAKYEMRMPVAKPGTFFNRPTALGAVTPEDHLQLVNFQAPEGCQRESLGVAGGMNETELTLTCETGNPALSRYRSD